MTLQNSKFKSKDFLILFLIAALPLHAWTIYLEIRDFTWIAERSNNVWDAVGSSAYGLVFAFIESIFIFGVLLIMIFIAPNKWSKEKRITLIATLYLIVSIWAVSGQVYFVRGAVNPENLILFLAESGHPLRWIYGVLAPIVFASIAVPVYLIFNHFDRMQNGAMEFINRLALLSGLYIFLDLVSLVIVFVRNLS